MANYPLFDNQLEQQRWFDNQLDFRPWFDEQLVDLVTYGQADATYGNAAPTYGPHGYANPKYANLLGVSTDTWTDTFTRVQAGGWGTFESPPTDGADAGTNNYNTTNNASDWSVDGAQGKLALPQARSAYVRTTVGLAGLYNEGRYGTGTIKVSLDGNGGAGAALPMTCGLLGGGSNSDASFVAAIRSPGLSPGTDTYFELFYVQNGDSLNRLARMVIPNFTFTDHWWIKLNISGEYDVQAKIWRDGDTEPASWTLAGAADSSMTTGHSRDTRWGVFVGSEQPGRTGGTVNMTFDSFTIVTPTSDLAGSDQGTGTDASTQTVHITRSDSSGAAAANAMSFWHRGSPLSPGNQSKVDTGNQTFWQYGSPLYPIANTQTALDTSTLHALYPQTDSAAGTDASTVSKTFPVTDSATGADVSTETATYARTDTGAGTDASTLAVHLNRTDSATGTDASTERVALPRTDSATGTDASQSTRPATDSATGTDASSERATYALTDSASGTDASHSIRNRTDSASGADASTLSAAISRTEAASGTDLSVLAAKPSRSDTGTSGDASTLHAAYSRQDSASGAESSAQAVSIHVTDSATATDAASLTTDDGNQTLNRTDTATAADLSVLAARYPKTESGTGVSESELAAAYAVTDSATGTDASTVVKVGGGVPPVIWQDGHIKVWLSGTDMSTAIYEPALDADPSAFFVAT